jgi:hypothetical protein
MDYKLSLYQAVEVEIGGQKYPLRKLNRKMFRELAELEKKEKEAASDFEKIDLGYESLNIFVDAPIAVLESLNPDEVAELRKIIDAEVFKSKPADKSVGDDPEKNALKPGEETAV